ncbi:unnamed protein product [Malassezia sympodialis ATCC 42132]|uniref:Similar to S.cerevisiae protein PHO11 (One of three repressible acid phosphatases) n=1 Tax=Malassezia sympodialis (strain ATCC 42132) TaxID=1230383 RepID=M5EDI4_MALS4|nr:uncharacterized protein MSY001_3138 [Malassezia sympodialis ATCC 42132]CCV00433.1 unnamed protein product [Malassezia sympodialis ATCC 42132]SHO79880.1 Similar to S.cerevisiae protein PHO11 (One of three repressible acid phosphatases) [Malassezia sympodialis ATCC 42132]|eukprot:XP_018741631.1 uncharacterized protein MSY001_3138 [Malassezia sympodialis ATCC 42132]
MKLFVALLATVSVCWARGTPTDPWNNVTGTSSQTFPTDVGFQGSVKYGAPPFLAQADQLKTSKPNHNSPVEMRWVPLNAEQDHATSDDIFRNLGSTSPYHQADDLFPETHGYENVPKQCRIKQAHILHRHGSRYPATGAGLLDAKLGLAQKLGNLQAQGDYGFLHSWKDQLGENALVHLGAQELFDSGVKYYYEYAQLLEQSKQKPVLRTTSQSRMIDSARYWALGFFGWDMADKAHIEVLTETLLQNNTLAPYMTCPNVFSPKALRILEWRAKAFGNAQKRLQENVKGVSFSKSDIITMIGLCGYETVSQGYSDFCKIFTKQDYEEYEYDQDLTFQSVFGFMSIGGRAMGIGWVTEFLSRLKGSGFHGPQTTQNSTLDSNPTYFPMHQPLYVDFTHDVVILTILTALNFRQIGDDLPGDHMNPNRRYRASRVTPFGARLVFEVMECDDDNGTTDYIRAKLNDAVVPLDGNQGCEGRRDGLCKLSDYMNFLEHHAYSMSNYDLLCQLKLDHNFNITALIDGAILSDDQVRELGKNPYHRSVLKHKHKLSKTALL